MFWGFFCVSPGIDFHNHGSKVGTTTEYSTTVFGDESAISDIAVLYPG